MVTFTNNKIIVTSDDPSYFALTTNLKVHKDINRNVYRKSKNGKISKKEIKSSYDEKYYTEFSDRIEINSGLTKYLRNYFTNSYIKDNRTFELSTTRKLGKDCSKYKYCLDGIELRDSQIDSLSKCFINQRCIIRLATGAGKSEIICAFIKVISDSLGYVPKTLVIEPTLVLCESMRDRFNNYGINCSIYNDNRNIDSEIIVAHPMSISNDASKSKIDLSRIKILIIDECHHAKSSTISDIYDKLTGIEYSLGFSASAIDDQHVEYNDIKLFDPDEVKVIGILGNLVVSVNPDNLIDKNYLATPVLMVMNNPADEKITYVDNWHEIHSNRLMSDNRNSIICRSSIEFVKADRKVLILVDTIEWSRKILSEFNRLGFSNCGASYGGRVFERIVNGIIEKTSDNLVKEFSDGDIKVLIGTSHIYEGIDIPNLDVIILAYGAKKERMQMQGIGRSLRLTKNGKYAYIVDFSDHNDIVLKRQLNSRMKRYSDMLGITDDRIFFMVNPDNIPEIMKNMGDYQE